MSLAISASYVSSGQSPGYKLDVSGLINLFSDNCNRTVAAGGVGTASDGHSYILVGTASDFSVNGSQIVVANPVAGASHYAVVDVGLPDNDVTWTFVCPVAPSGDSLPVRTIARWDTSNSWWYGAQCDFRIDGQIKLRLIKQTTGLTVIGLAAGIFKNYSAGDQIKVRCLTSGTTIAAKFWNVTALETEPTTWELTTTDTDISAGTRIGFNVGRNSANTDTNPVINVDDGIDVYGNAYSYTVTRVGGTPFSTGPVRSMDSITIVSDTDSQMDYEFSFLDNFHYRADLKTVTGTLVTSAATSAIDGQTAAADLKSLYGSWWPQLLIRSTQAPSLNQLCQVSDFRNWTKPGRVLANHNVLGRANPVVITDRSGGRTGTFTLLQTEPPSGPGVFYPNSASTLEDLLDYGDTLMFQCLYYSPMYRDMFFKVTDYTVNRLNTIQPWTTPSGAQYGHVLTYEISFVEVDRPVTASVQDRVLTWEDILNSYPTWQDVLNDNNTWLDVLSIRQ